jgi:hypothetical protein
MLSSIVISDQRLYALFNTKLFNKACEVELACYEDPDDFYNSYTKATSEAETRAMVVLDNFFEGIGAVCAATYVLITMCSLDNLG